MSSHPYVTPRLIFLCLDMAKTLPLEISTENKKKSLGVGMRYGRYFNTTLIVSN